MNSSSSSSFKPGALEDAHVFDVDPQTGFMPSTTPLSRLPRDWEAWEAILDDAITLKLQVGDKSGLEEGEKAVSEAWRVRVRALPLLQTMDLESSAALLRRAHLVLAFIMHFYIQSLPPDVAVLIPRPLAIPILHVSARLDIPPLLTYSDTVLYNWIPNNTPTSPSPLASDERDSPPPPPPSLPPLPTIDNIHSKTMFSNLIDEEEFYLCSARIEVRGVEALELMRATMDEIFIGDSTAVHRISSYLHTMASVISDMKTLLLDVRKWCRPNVYYNEVRPWFRGEDSDDNGRKWVFEGMEEVVGESDAARQPVELSGPSAGQSSIVHVLDVFLGVDHGRPASEPAEGRRASSRPSFMSRMQRYMPRNHRLFLDHLAANSRPLRAFVAAKRDGALHEAYNGAVLALKEFRDAHMIIAALYIVGPARMAAKAKSEQVQSVSQSALVVVGRGGGSEERKPLKGTGGTDLVKFLKDTRRQTSETML